MINFQKFRSLYWEDRSGASAIEAAICFPIIIILFFACFQYGMFYNNMTQLNKKLEAASRQVKIMDNPTEETLQAHYQSFIENSDDIELSVKRVEKYEEQFVQVNMTYEYAIDIPLLKDYPFSSKYQNLVILSSDT